MKYTLSYFQRLSVVLLLGLAAFSVAQGDISTNNNNHKIDFLRQLQEVLDRYEIGESRISFSGTIVRLVFPINDLNLDGTVEIATFSDNMCSVNIDGNDYLMPEIIYDENPNPDGSKNREVTIQYTVDPTKIQTTDVWLQESDDTFFMNFCVSFGLKLNDGPNAVTIATLETVVRLQVDLMGDFGVEVEVDENDQAEFGAEEAYFVVGFLCGNDNAPITYSEPRVQGSLVRVCVRPEDVALQDGIYMRSVQSFTFVREDFGGRQVTQAAVKDGASANPALTTLSCTRGTELCWFDTVLKGDFYYSPGTVSGFGEAWLQVRYEWIRSVHFLTCQHLTVFFVAMLLSRRNLVWNW